MTFDEKCYDLARHFLQDEPELTTERNARRLAAEIQSTIEDWINYEKRDPLPDPNGPASADRSKDTAARDQSGPSGPHGGHETERPSSATPEKDS